MQYVSWKSWDKDGVVHNFVSWLSILDNVFELEVKDKDEGRHWNDVSMTANNGLHELCLWYLECVNEWILSRAIRKSCSRNNNVHDADSFITCSMYYVKSWNVHLSYLVPLLCNRGLSQRVSSGDGIRKLIGNARYPWHMHSVILLQKLIHNN